MKVRLKAKYFILTLITSLLSSGSGFDFDSCSAVRYFGNDFPVSKLYVEDIDGRKKEFTISGSASVRGWNYNGGSRVGGAHQQQAVTI
ncbi:MAG: hypothetical protein GDA48_23190 [Hormoscilla sp. GM102CHS1]|nr:hypothetical protein [Hormoscilla sp. GM102CHS1]